MCCVWGALYRMVGDTCESVKSMGVNTDEHNDGVGCTCESVKDGY